MIYEIAAFTFAMLTGYVASKYEGKIISRVSVFMLLTASAGFLAETVAGEENLLGALFCLVIGHILSEQLCSKYLVQATSKQQNNTDIKSTNDLLQQLANNKDLKLETEISIKVK
jgi:sugar phosphate permease